MAADKNTGRKIVIPKKKVAGKRKYTKRTGRKPEAKEPMLFGKVNFKWMLIGIGFIVLGLILMLGGDMPSPDVWDESLIYSHRRITIAPLLMLIGFCLQIYAIFKK